MRLSIIMPFLNSHELVRRQILNFRQLELPDDVEILFVDDGSDPPHQMPSDPPRNFSFHATNDYRPWTSSLARNRAAKLARGEYLFMLDGDYFLTREAVDIARQFTGDRLGTRRELAVLDEHGRMSQNTDVLLSWGVTPERLHKRGAKLPPHSNQYIMRAAVFELMGGYDEDRIVRNAYPQGEDSAFRRKLRQFANDGKITLTDEQRPTIYMWPNGQFCGDVDANPFGLFHALSRKTRRNALWHKMEHAR